MQKDVDLKLRMMKLCPDKVRAGQTLEVTMEVTMEVATEVAMEVTANGTRFGSSWNQVWTKSDEMLR